MVAKPMGPGGTNAAGSAERIRRRAPDESLLAAPDRPAEGFIDRHADRPEAMPPAPQAGIRRAITEADRMMLLSRTVETEVVPRLVLVHRAPPAPGRGRTPPVRPRDVTTLARHILADDGVASEGVIEAARSRGATLEQVALELMAPVARRLGEMWDQDDCTYTDVTMGVWRLQGLLRALSPVFQPQSDPAHGHARRAMITVMPGESHAFGTDMVSGFLRLSGWEVCNEPVATAEELARRIGRDSITVAGLSCGCGDNLPEIATLLSTIRRAAGGRPVGIMVGGHVFTNAPQSALVLGADAVALDARHAVRQAESLLRLLGVAH